MQQSIFSPPTESSSTPNLSVSGEGSPDTSAVLKQSLESATFTVIDLETTGLSAKRNAITEVTAIQFVNGEAKDMYSTLVQPNEAISQEVEDLTGISNEMVKSAPPLVIVLHELLSFMGPNPLIVGHNVPFDIGFLREKCEQSGLLGAERQLDIEQAFCTKVLAQKALPMLPSYEGIVVATQCGYHNDNPHRAEADVRMSAAILFALIQKVKEEGTKLKTVEDLLTYQGRLQLR